MQALLLPNDGEPMRKLMEKIVNALISREAEEQIGASAYERTEERTAYRNGYREREFTTRVGTITLRIPKLREGTFTIAIFASYQRSEQALLLCMMEMVLQGISTRKVSEVTELLCGKMFSAQTISNLCKEIDPAVKEFRERQLTGRYPFIVCDALYMRVHEGAKVVSTGIMIALEINEQGHREVLGFDIIKNESTSGWKEFFQSLKARGLSGVKLITSDVHCGIKQAYRKSFPGLPGSGIRHIFQEM